MGDGQGEVEGQIPSAPTAPEEVVGNRTARARFPDMTPGDPAHLFANDPRNLEAANALRNKGVGVMTLTPDEESKLDMLDACWKKHVFTQKAIKESAGRMQSWADSLPAKLTANQRAKVVELCLHEPPQKGGKYARYSDMVEAFVKAEVVGKPKPRPIANHKEIRLGALARVAWVFEDVMFDALKYMTIKHRPKDVALNEMFKHFSKMRSGVYVENDLTAFEFGVSKRLKELEQGVLRHIAKELGVWEEGMLFERVVSDRSRACTWKMRYKDPCGEMKTLHIKMPRPMRESGDRLTSSGNFFQNVCCWLVFLCEPDQKTFDRTFAQMVATRGKNIFYISARDKQKYLARLGFEGDDTAGRLEEALVQGFAEEADKFMRRYGWSPKLSFKPLVGPSYLRFCGWDALIMDGVVQEDFDGVVMCPEISRLLKTKQWTCTAVSDGELRMCNRIYATVMAQGFARVAPMWWFCRNLFDANAGGATKLSSDDVIKEYHLGVFGELPGDGRGAARLASLPFPQLEGDSKVWRLLAEVSAGPVTDVEWASMQTTMTFEHGADLAVHFPASWLR